MEVDSNNVPEAKLIDLNSDRDTQLTVTMKEYTNNGETNFVQEPVLLNYEIGTSVVDGNHTEINNSQLTYIGTIIGDVNHTEINNAQIIYLFKYILILNLFISIIYTSYVPYTIYPAIFIVFLSFLGMKIEIFRKPLFFFMFLFLFFKIVIFVYIFILTFIFNIVLLKDIYFFIFMAFLNIFLEAFLVKLNIILIMNSYRGRIGNI